MSLDVLKSHFTPTYGPCSVAVQQRSSAAMTSLFFYLAAPGETSVFITWKREKEVKMLFRNLSRWSSCRYLRWLFWLDVGQECSKQRLDKRKHIPVTRLKGRVGIINSHNNLGPLTLAKVCDQFKWTLTQALSLHYPKFFLKDLSSLTFSNL